MSNVATLQTKKRRLCDLCCVENVFEFPGGMDFVLNFTEARMKVEQESTKIFFA